MKKMGKVISIASGKAQSADPMDSWYDKAWVRQKRIEYQIPETVVSPVLFSPRLVPSILHPRIVERGESFSHAMLAHRFFGYAHFTSVLERDAVNVATAKIAAKRFWSRLPDKMYLGAGRIYTDEGFHAQESDEILAALSNITGISPRFLSEPQFIKNLRALLAPLDPRRQDIALMGFVIVSETLISAILADIPNDPFVVAPVRDFVREHAKDEGKHHAYFSELLNVGWPELAPAEQEFLGPLIAQFVRWFLDPDTTWLRSFLAESGFQPKYIDEIIHDSYSPAEIESGIRIAARHSIAKFSDVGMLASNRTSDAFQAAGLIVHDKHPPLSQVLEPDATRRII